MLVSSAAPLHVWLVCILKRRVRAFITFLTSATTSIYILQVTIQKASARIITNVNNWNPVRDLGVSQSVAEDSILLEYQCCLEGNFLWFVESYCLWNVRNYISNNTLSHQLSLLILFCFNSTHHIWRFHFDLECLIAPVLIVIWDFKVKQTVKLQIMVYHCGKSYSGSRSRSGLQSQCGRGQWIPCTHAESEVGNSAECTRTDFAEWLHLEDGYSDILPAPTDTLHTPPHSGMPEHGVWFLQ